MSVKEFILKPRYKIQDDFSGIAIKIFGYFFLSLFALMCLLPFWLMVAGSFTADGVIRTQGYSLIPPVVSFEALNVLLMYPQFLMGSYFLTFCITIGGTAVGLFITSMAAYALQRPDFEWRNKISFYFYFTMLFFGGLVPYYIMMVRYLHLKNNYLAVLLPSLVGAWNIIMMKNFMKSIPHSLTESALIDGAGDFRIFLMIFLPMSGPSLATIGLFMGLGYWNEWYNALLFLDNTKYIPLQLYLYNMIMRADFIRNSAALANIPPQDTPGESLKMATALLSTGPILIMYPFVQRFFIKGITIGAVKG
jgi:putative aldouronate transport system permease protein